MTPPLPRCPVIGIVGHGHVVTRPFGELDIVGTPTRYVQHVTGAGGRPVVLTGPDAVHLLDVVEAIVLTGGGDVDPRRYGGAPEDARDVDTGRDETEIALVRAAARSGIPLLGVCRGLQVMIVAFGGTLRADFANAHLLVEDEHLVETTPGSVIRRLLGDRQPVSSLHHQAAAVVASCWRATARAGDGVVEAIEWVGPGRWPALGVQWHPEFGIPGDSPLFDWLVGEAAARAPVAPEGAGPGAGRTPPATAAS